MVKAKKTPTPKKHIVCVELDLHQMVKGVKRMARRGDLSSEDTLDVDNIISGLMNLRELAGGARVEKEFTKLIAFFDDLSREMESAMENEEQIADSARWWDPS